MLVSKSTYQDVVPADGWVKSRRSGPYSDNCVELVQVGDAVAMRDSTAPDGPVLVFTAGEITAFLEGVHDGEFDHLIA